MTKKQELLELFKKYNKISIHTVYELMSTTPQHTIRGRLSDLVKEGYLQRVDDSLYEIVKEPIIQELQKENDFLKQQLVIATKPQKIEAENTTQIKLGVISDTHIGSIYENLEFLHTAYKTFNEQQITTVLHAGDFFDGENVFKGQKYLLHTIGIDNIIKYAELHYPKYDNIITYVIGGSHDFSYYKSAGCNILALLNNARKDIINLGFTTRKLDISLKDNTINILLYHTNGATSINTPKKVADTIKLHKRPHILIIGHTHKTALMKHRDIIIMHPGSIQLQTPFMKGIPTEAAVGFWTIEIIAKNNLIQTLSASWTECIQ